MLTEMWTTPLHGHVSTGEGQQGVMAERMPGTVTWKRVTPFGPTVFGRSTYPHRTRGRSSRGFRRGRALVPRLSPAEGGDSTRIPAGTPEPLTETGGQCPPLLTCGPGNDHRENPL